MATDRRLRYVGVDRRGNGRAGATYALAPAKLAELLYDQGYRRATITNDGEIVGEVFRRDGRRTWWGESDGEMQGTERNAIPGP